MPADTETTRREIAIEVLEAETLMCRSCTTIVEAPGYCRTCADYWNDVRNGLWDDDPRDDDEEDGGEDCGLMPGGQCLLAGTEHCDWDCGRLR